MKKETPCIIIYWWSANYNEKCKKVFLCYRISITYIVYHIRNGIVSIMWYLLPNMFFSRKSHLYRYMFFRVPIEVGSYQFDIQTLRFPSKPSICLFFMLLLLFIVISLELDCIIFQIVENMPFLALIYRCNSMEYPLLLMRLQKMFSKMFSRKIDLKLVTYSEEQLPSLRICMMLHSLITVFHMLFKKSNLKNSWSSIL